MSNITDTKPEPISAKPNWHYDSYFLSQLQRIYPQKHGNTNTQDKPEKPVKISIKNAKVEDEQDI